MRRPPLLTAFCLSSWLAAQDAVPFGEILPDHRCEHTFVAARDGLQGVAVPIATYARPNACTLVAELFENDTRLAHAEWRAASLADNAEIELPCPPQPTSRGRSYRLLLRSPDAKPGDAVTTWITPGGGPRLRTSYAGDTLMLGEITAAARVVQTFVAAADGLCGVQVLLTDFGRANRGTLQLSLRDPVAGREIATTTVDAATVGNEDWRGLEFAPIPDANGRTFALALESPDGQPGTAATAYLDRGASYRGELSLGGAPRLGRLMLTTAYTAAGTAWATIAGRIAGSLSALLAIGALRARSRRRPVRTWLAAAIAAAAVPLVGIGYGADRRLLFWSAAFAGSIALLVTAAGARRRRALALQLAFVPLLLFVLLLLAEPFGARQAAAAGGATATDVDLHEAPWSYERSKGDPAAFRRWWQRLTGEWNSPDRGCALVQRPDPLGELPFVLQPDTTTRFFESTIRVNNLGFRGPDVDRDKHGGFRVVCLGESTTMGQTLFATDRPWPEALQERLTTPDRRRRIEVINAGWASYDIRHSAIRLRRFVLDLAPDLVVVYHGYNGFWMLLPDVAPALVAGARLPRRVDRPSWLLANAEYALALTAFRRAMATPPAAAAADVDASPCARAYRELIDTCTARGIAVALCSFNMAVDERSPPEVVAFYRAGFPQVERQIAANALQTALLRRLAAPEHGVTFVDAGSGLAGAYGDAFVDLVHFTQAGRERMAANVAAGIRALLPD